MVTPKQIATWAKTPIAIVESKDETGKVIHTVQRFKTDKGAEEILEGRPNETYVLEKQGEGSYLLVEVK